MEIEDMAFTIVPRIAGACADPDSVRAMLRGPLPVTLLDDIQSIHSTVTATTCRRDPQNIYDPHLVMVELP